MVMCGAVPAAGFWNTRPMHRARRWSLSRVTSRPSIRMLPPSARMVPATTLSSVDLPAPFEPMTVTKSPGASVQAHVGQGRPRIQGAGEERHADVVDREHGQPSFSTRAVSLIDVIRRRMKPPIRAKPFHCGSTSAMTTRTAEISFMSFGFSPAFRAR